MTTPPKTDYSVDQLEEKYNDIAVLYDYAEELVATVESKLVKNPDKQLDIVEPLVGEIGDAVDILTEEFVLVAESHSKKKQSKASKSRIEAALRKLYVAVGDYQARVQDVSKKAHGAIQNIADPIVAKIHRQIEKVVVIFLEFVQLSLQSLMGKVELEALKAHDPRVALMMHQHALSQQQG